ncbi:MAG: tRNA (adenosine(37)-N6)-threonylcarbamoyltransferase complex ATPase subunit type 1 TsaE [Hyphomonadaceae bacterium]|nr:tRNA (adenosine(37)-N6)-threonylcarbamoyltransferase complex ATPase subunit type 1 TsaE [Hyphomonadaceae bacterium]
MIIKKLHNPEAMRRLGAGLAGYLRAGDVLALTGGLGTGKTTLSRGLIQALCDVEPVPSPTYTLVQTYRAAEFEIWHCDLYRLEEPEDIYELGVLDAMEEKVVLIEWPERMSGFLPDERLRVHIDFEGEGRIIKFSGSPALIDKLQSV